MRRHALFLISIFFIMSGFMLIGRLVWLQVFQHSEMVALADKQQIRTVAVNTSQRGIVLDCWGEAITNNTPGPGLLIFPSLVGDVEETAAFLAAKVNIKGETLIKKIAGLQKEGSEIRYPPFYAKSNLTVSEVEALENSGLSGFFIVDEESRYQRDTPLLHTLGSLGTVSEEQILKGEVDADYQSGDLIGISGLERIYEQVLKGVKSKGFGILVDEKNRVIRPGQYFLFPGEEGEEKNESTLRLTIDLSIERAVESALATVEGAAVVLDSNSGDVLAMASSPKFDPLYIEEPTGKDAYVNKSISPYPPASLFKIFITAVGLEEGVIQKETPVLCNGSYHLDNGRQISCWRKEGHGLMLFDNALGQSCNPVYVDLGLRIGAKRLQKAFKEWELHEDILLGYPLGELSAVNLDGQSDGVVANATMGEEGVLMTPLNIAKMINVIASGGLLTTPRLVTEIEVEGEVETIAPAFKNRLISKKVAQTVTAMMQETFTKGTGASLGLESLNMAGKTGSSETGNVWMGGFLPADDPQYTVVILVENGSSGVGDAGPVFKKICGYLQTLSR